MKESFGESAWQIAKNALGTLGTLLAGISAILYGLGFLSEQAHTAMLGTPNITLDTLQLLNAGGIVIYRSLFSIAHVLLYLPEYLRSNISYSLSILIFFALFFFAASRLVHFYSNRVTIYLSRKMQLILVYAYIFFFGIFLLIYFSQYTVGLKDLLFYDIPEAQNSNSLIDLKKKIEKNPESSTETLRQLEIQIQIAKAWERNPIRNLVLDGNYNSLSIHFGQCIIFVFVYGIFLQIVRSIERQDRGADYLTQVALRRASIALFFFFLVLLPVVFGYILHRNEYPICALKDRDDVVTSPVALLGTTSSEVIAYRGHPARQIIIYPKIELKQIRCWTKQLVFDARAYHVSN